MIVELPLTPDQAAALDQSATAAVQAARERILDLPIDDHPIDERTAVALIIHALAGRVGLL